jgi:hypothetical protein
MQLFHKMQTALGGGERIADIQDFEQCVRADTWDNNGKRHGQVYKRTRWIRPNVLRLDQVGPGDTYVLYFNGASGWEKPVHSAFRAIVISVEHKGFIRRGEI